MKTLIVSPRYFAEEAISVFQELGEVDTLNTSLGKKGLLDVVEDYDILAIKVDTIIDREVFDKAKNLKVIASATTGVNHIDLDCAKEKGVNIVSLIGAHTESTAEYVFALLLSLLRNISFSNKSLLEGNWERKRFIGTELFGKTIGIVGYGKIGRHVGIIAKGFGMKILFFDPYVENVEGKCDMDTLLRESDVVTLHCLLNEETKGMLNYEKFKMMKRNAVLINCSRGPIVNDEDLVRALEEGEILAAGLDVFDREPLTSEHILVRKGKELRNLLITPHVAGSTNEALKRSSLFVAKKTKDLLMDS